MRVISGKARGRKLFFFFLEEVRPTTDRVKEAMFSILHFNLQGSKVLDLFAGSGQLGIEAISRGAKICTFVDNSREAQKIQLQNLKLTNLFKNSRVVFSDGPTFLKTTTEKYDIIILDPPYKTDLIPKILRFVSKSLTDSGIVMCEHLNSLEMPENFCDIALQKRYKYGKIILSTYRKIGKAKEEYI